MGKIINGTVKYLLLSCRYFAGVIVNLVDPSLQLFYRSYFIVSFLLIYLHEYTQQMNNSILIMLQLLFC